MSRAVNKRLSVGSKGPPIGNGLWRIECRVRWRHVTLDGQGCLTYLLSIRGIKVTTTVP